MKSMLIALACVLLANLASAQTQEWKSHRTTDGAGNDVIWIASIGIVVRHTDYEFYVSCRSVNEVIVAFSAPNIHPGAEDYWYYDYYAMQVRFDDGKEEKMHFVEQQDVMFLNPSPLMVELGKLDPQGLRAVRARQQQVFIKMLSEHEKLRILFPHAKGPILLEFPLEGSKAALLVAHPVPWTQDCLTRRA